MKSIRHGLATFILLLALALPVLAQTTASPVITAPTTSSFTGSYTTSWTQIPSATSYVLYETSPSGAKTSFTHAGVANTSHPFTKTVNGKYVYSVRPYFTDSTGKSIAGVASAAVAQYVALPPAKPTVSVLTSPSINGQYRVVWTKPLNAMHYELSEYDSSVWRPYNYYGEFNTNDFFTKTKNATWKYRVRAMSYDALKNTLVYGPYSDEVAAVVNVPASTKKVLLYDEFKGPSLDTNVWALGTWPLGKSTILGGKPTFTQNGASSYITLHMDTYNPKYPGTYFLGTEIYSTNQFVRWKGLEMEARVRVRTEVPGIIDSFFSFGIHPDNTWDEIDFEYLTNFDFDHLLLTTWNDWDYVHWNDGVHQSSTMSVATGLNRKGWNILRIRWLPDHTEWLVNDVLVRSSAAALPNDAMNIRANTWASDATWADAYNNKLVPTSSAAANVSYLYDIDYIRLTWLQSPTTGDYYPTAPTGFTGTAAAGTGIVNLNWQNPPTDNATAFEIYRAEKPVGTAAPAFTKIQTLAKNVRSATDDVFKTFGKFGTFLYKIRAVTELGPNFSETPTIEVVVSPPPAPAVPINLKGTVDTLTVQLSWQAPGTTADHFEVYRAAQPSGTASPSYFLVYSTPNATTLSFPDNLSSYGTWLYKVRAVNRGSFSAFTSPLTVVAIRPPAPNAPFNLMATASFGSVTLTWTAPSGPIKEYQVQVASKPLSGQPNFYYATYTDGRNTSVQHSPGYGTFYYKIVAINDGGTSPFSNMVEVTTVRPPSPAAPTNLSATFLNGVVTVAWQAPSTTANNFTLYRANKPTGSETPSFGYEGSTSNLSHLVLDDIPPFYGTFLYKVGASNDGGSTDSGLIEVTIPRPTSVPAPTNLLSNKASYGIELLWKNNNVAYSSYICSYKIYRATKPTGGGTPSFSLISTYAGGAERAVDNNPLNGTSIYKVVALIYDVESAPTTIEVTYP